MSVLSGAAEAGAGFARVATRLADDAAHAAPAVAEAANAPRVVIAGAGPTGMSVALGLARHGIPSTVVEAYPRVASRGLLLNVSPTTIDELAHIGAQPAIDALSAVRGSSTSVYGKLLPPRIAEAPELIGDATRARGEMADMLAALQGKDLRPWGRARIADIENGLRQTAEQQHSKLIDTLYDYRVTAVEQSERGVRALLAPRSGEGPARSVDGAYMVMATGGRNPIGVTRKMQGPKLHFLGGNFPPAEQTSTSILKELENGVPQTTIGLRYGKPDGYSLIWAQVDQPAASIDEAAARAILRDRARKVSVDGPLISDKLIPVEVQLGRADTAVQGRVLLAGDETMAPYFPSSTGANKGMGVDARKAVDAIVRAVRDGDHGTSFARYNHEVLEGDRLLHQYNVESLGEALTAPTRRAAS